jgi:hypothetical protein
VSALLVEGNLERWRTGVERVGKYCPVVWDVEWRNAKIIKIQYMLAFIGHQLANQNTTTNQKQVAVTEGSMEGILNEWDAWGKRDAIILGAL